MEMPFRTVIVPLLVVAASSLVLAEESQEPKTSEKPEAEKACFRVRDTRSFDAVDDRFVYLRCIRDRNYLLTMDNACIGLQNSIAIAVASGYDRVCSNDRAFITYREFDQKRRCGILNVEQVKDREDALELIERRKTPKSSNR